jgi:hypothetical protein
MDDPLERWRVRLQEAVETWGSLHHPVVLTLSRVVDAYVLQHYRAASGWNAENNDTAKSCTASLRSRRPASR